LKLSKAGVEYRTSGLTIKIPHYVVKGSRKRGRPRNSWQRSTLTEAGKRSWKELRSSARDRRKWKELVDNLCS
jgi:hypothetical protein